MRRTELGTVIGMATGLLALASCNVGPDYHAPATTMPAAWTPPTTAPTTVPSQTDDRSAESVRWWKTFNDPTLDWLINEAVAANLDVQLAEARIRQVRASLGIATGAQWPNASANAAYKQARTSGFGNTNEAWQAGFDASWELDIFGGVRRGVEAANAEVFAAYEDRRAVLITLMGDVAATYIDLRGVQDRIGIARQNLALQENTLAVTRRRQGAGFVGKLDVANAESQVATTKSLIPSLEQQVRQNIYALSVLLGRQPAALLGELTTAMPIPLTPPMVPAGLPSDLLRRRPDIRQAEAQIHGATARIGVATADLFPKFSLTGNFGIAANQFSGMGNWNNRYWAWGPSMTWSIFSAGAVQSNIKVQEALRDQALIGYQKTVLIALQDVDGALVAYEKEQERRATLADAVKANRQAVELSMQLYTLGQVEFLDVLNAQRSLLASEDAWSASTRTVATNLVALYKALGGGWEQYAFPATEPTTRPSLSWTP